MKQVPPPPRVCGAPAVTGPVLPAKKKLPVTSMAERKPETGSAWFVIPAAVWAGGTGAQREMARMVR